MALLYSYQNQPPVPLPERFRLPDGLTRRPPLTDEELGELGWAGPINVPSFDPETQVLQWDTNDMEYVVLDLAPQELEERAKQKARAKANYQGFYDALISGPAYQSIRVQAMESLALTVACTEFIAAVSDAKLGRPNELALQACIDNILAASILSDDELQEIYLHMAAHGVWGLLNLGDFEPVIPEPPAQPEPLPVEPVAAVEPQPQETDTAPDDDTFAFTGGVTSGSYLTADTVFGTSGEDTLAL
jgi:hypothetical protein